MLRPLIVLEPGPDRARSLMAGVQIARAADGSLTIAHAVNTSRPWWSTALGDIPGPTIARDARIRGEQLLAAARDDIPADVNVSTRLIWDRRPVAEQLLELLTSSDHDLLILAGVTNGCYRQRARTRRLLERCPVPILAIGTAVPGTRDAIAESSHRSMAAGR
jgi:hypothetical protein